MSREDMRVVGRIRGILGKHFLELDELHINCTKGVVRITGTVKRLGHPAELSSLMPITEKFLNDLRNEIKRLPNVRRVLFATEGESEG
jgi:hypothetical protein